MIVLHEHLHCGSNPLTYRSAGGLDKKANRRDSSHDKMEVIGPEKQSRKHRQ